jgi:hypothetical protein
MDITNLDNDFVTLEIKLKNDYNDIMIINNYYKENLHFMKVMKIYNKNLWDELNTKYKNLKKTITNNKQSYKKLINDYQLLYKYYDIGIIEHKNNKINKFNSIIHNNTFYMLNLQKNHSMIYISCMKYSKMQSTIKINYIHPLMDTIYMIINSMNKMIVIIKKNKYKLLSLLQS